MKYKEARDIIHGECLIKTSTSIPHSRAKAVRSSSWSSSSPTVLPSISKKRLGSWPRFTCIRFVELFLGRRGDKARKKKWRRSILNTIHCCWLTKQEIPTSGGLKRKKSFVCSKLKAFICILRGKTSVQIKPVSYFLLIIHSSSCESP